MTNMATRYSWFVVVGLALAGCDFSSSKGEDNLGSVPSGGTEGEANEGGTGGSGDATATGGTPVIEGGQGGTKPVTGGAGGTSTGGATGTATGGAAGTATGGTAGQGNVGYPAGPYGFAIGNTVANAEFKDGNGKVVKLSEMRMKPGAKVTLHKEYSPNGLLVFESLH